MRLVRAARVLAQHSKLVYVRADSTNLGVRTCLFQPELSGLTQRGIAATDAVVDFQPGQEGTTLLLVNNGMEPVQLDEGEALGTLQPATVLEMTYQDEPNHGQVAALSTLAGSNRVSQVIEALEVDSIELQPAEMEQLRSLVIEYNGLFALNTTELGRTSVVTHTIDTGDHLPVRQAPRRIPFSLRGRVDQLVKDMLEQEVITPSASPWASPVVLVAKKDGSTCFCVDYLKLNAATKADVYPLTRIDDSLDLLAGTQYFNSLDLASGHWQVGMEDGSREKTAFTTRRGLYEFRVGLCNAPATFQRLMENVLADLVQQKCLIYLDDVVVIGQTFSEHLSNLQTIFERLWSAGLRLKPAKCKLVQQEVEFLGYRVSRSGISTEPRKVAAVKEYPIPQNVRALREFLGLASYYRRFILLFSSVAKPLYALTRKEVPFVWSEDCAAAFEGLRTRLTKAPVLAYPQFDREFLLETDASGMGLGAVLSQEQDDKSIRPISYASRTLQPHERNYGISELEALGVVWAAKHESLFMQKCSHEEVSDGQSPTSITLDSPSTAERKG